MTQPLRLPEGKNPVEWLEEVMRDRGKDDALMNSERTRAKSALLDFFPANTDAGIPMAHTVRNRERLGYITDAKQQALANAELALTWAAMIDSHCPDEVVSELREAYIRAKKACDGDRHADKEETYYPWLASAFQKEAKEAVRLQAVFSKGKAGGGGPSISC